MTKTRKMRISVKQENWLKKAISSTLVVAIVFIAGGFTAVEQALAAPSLNTYRLTFSGSNNQNPDAAIDSAGNVSAVYERSGMIYYKQNRQTEEAVIAGTNPAMALDNAGNVHVVFISSGTFVKYIEKTAAGWQPAVDIGSGSQADITVDASGKVYLALIRTESDGYSDLLYINNTSGDFNSATPEIVEDGKLDGALTTNYTDPTIKIDGAGKYHIAYLNTTYTGDPTSSAKYVQVKTNAADGNSVSDNLGYTSTGILSANSLVLNGTTAEVIYVADVSAVYLAKITASASWDVSTVVAGGGSKPTLALNGVDPSVTYEFSGNVVYDEDNGSGFGAQVDVDTSSNNPVVVLNSTNKYVYYVKSGDIYLATDKNIIDQNPPVISGVIDGNTYTSAVTITYTDAENEGPVTATLDGAAFASGDSVNTNGAHTLVVTDAAGNTATVSFT
ncbi:MAG: hypothetical protein WCX71_04280, partial [Candidatus Buchananbacteria bacterium]